MPISEELLEQIRSNKYTDKILSLAGQEIDDNDAKALAEALKGNTHIEKVDLSNNEIGKEGAKYLCKANIKSLDLSGNSIGEGARVFSKTDCITELSLSECEISDSVAKDIFKNTRLQKLDLSSNALNDEAVKEIPEGSILSSLMLAQNQITAEGSKSIANHKNLKKTLKEIDLGSNKIKDEGIESFAESAQLQRLGLMCNSITGKGFSKLCESGSIEELYLFNNDISFNEEDVLPESSSFVKLNLSFNKLNGRCEKVLKTLASMPKLQELDLSSNNIDKTGMGILHKYQLSSLKTIKLSDNPISESQESVSPGKKKRKHESS